ncbi:MAG: benzoate/H(+) symporter BenE family transporter [Solirubrobacterales bacterium]|nr:benzoate/H(+) symporter BenE family transporter [Solirubrobacterales bacterium]
MASQNLAGLSVLHLHGYRPRLRSVLSGTGGISALIAPLGGLPSTWPRSPPP